MPRPKRSRVAPTRAAQPMGSPVAAPKPTTSTTDRDSDPGIDETSNSEKAKEIGRRSLSHQKVVASARMRSVTTTTTTTSMSLHQTMAVAKARERRDFAMERLENITSTSNSNTGAMGADDDDVDLDDSDGDGSIELGRRAPAATTPRRGRMTNLSGLDLDDEIFNNLDTSFDTAGPASAQPSADTSTFSASHFKRRPRAGSFLHRDDGPIRPSSRAGHHTPSVSSTFNIGVFKRRAREPSILGTARKPRPPQPEPEHEDDQGEEDDAENEDEGVVASHRRDLSPEVESTPLRRSKRGLGEVGADAKQASHSSASNPRKRKSTEGQEKRARSSPFDGDHDEHVIRNSIEQAQDEVEESLPSSPPRLSLSRQRGNLPSTPVVDEELMAPPLSSGSSEDDEVWPPLQTLAKRRRRRASSPMLRRTPVRIENDNISDMSSPPSLTHSPNYEEEPSPPPARVAKPTRKAAAAKKPVTKLTTADLKDLLPRRRHRKPRAGEDGEDEEDSEVDVSGLGNDEDELSYLDVRSRRRPASRNQKTAAVRSAAAATTTTRSNQQRNKQGLNSSVTKTKKSRPSRTYGRSASDKENEENSADDVVDAENGEDEDEDDDTLGPPPRDGRDEESSQEMVDRVGEELKKAARKFKEVDKWELAYEEMTQSSSPRGAR